MGELDNFLTKNVEGYLLQDLKTLETAKPTAGETAGAVGYPLLLACFAGIELLGCLLSKEDFDPKDPGQGRRFFKHFWREHLYKEDPKRQDVADDLYTLARNGLAHVFLVKENVEVCKGRPDLHLKKRRRDGMTLIDACELARDLRRAYFEEIPPGVNGLGAELRPRMEEQFQRLKDNYTGQAKERPALAALPEVDDNESVPTPSGAPFKPMPDLRSTPG